MKQLFVIRRMSTIYILVLLYAYVLFNTVYSFQDIKECVIETMDLTEYTAKEKIALVESSIEEALYGRYMWVESYGLMQAVMDKDEFENFTIAKDENEELHYIYFKTQESDVTTILEQTSYLQSIVESSGAEFFYLMPISKIVDGYTTFDTGIPYADENIDMDHFLEGLSQEEIAYLDLRDAIDESGISYDDRFYDTDHHWTTYTAFWAFTQVVDYIETSYGYMLDEEDFYTNLEHYNQIHYEQKYLGSLGRNTGVIYSGVDDFTLIYPKFSTNYQYVAMDEEIQIAFENETFEGALLNLSAFYGFSNVLDSYDDMYLSYLFGNYGYGHIENNNIEDGLRVLFIKDSFAVPVAAFLSTTCSTVDLIDPRSFSGDIEEVIGEGEYDVVILSYSGANLTEEFFVFN